MNLSNMTHYGYETIANNSVYNVLKQDAQNRSKTELAELDKSIDSLTNTSIKVNFNESSFKIKSISKMKQVENLSKLDLAMKI